MFDRIFPRTAVLASASVAIAFTASSASAYTFDDVIVEEWIGDGHNQTMLVTDFGGESFAFGYRFTEDTVTGWDFITTVADQVELFDLHYTDHGWGIMIDTLAYSGYTKGDAENDDDWVGIWVADDGAQWDFASVGLTDLDLGNQSWLGTSHGFVSPVTPIPEPSTLALLGLATLGLLGRNRRRG